jgi:hypothetical protein
MIYINAEMTRYRNLYMFIKIWEEHFLRQIIKPHNNSLMAYE